MNKARKATLQKGYSAMCSGYPQSGAQQMWATAGGSAGYAQGARAGLVRSALQEDASAAEVGQLLLQGIDLLFAQGQLQLHAMGGEVFLHQ